MKLTERERPDGTACPLCREAVASDRGEAVRACSGCGVRYHEECWEELGGCATLGCVQVDERAVERLETLEEWWQGRRSRIDPTRGVGPIARQAEKAGDGATTYDGRESRFRVHSTRRPDSAVPVRSWLALGALLASALLVYLGLTVVQASTPRALLLVGGVVLFSLALLLAGVLRVMSREELRRRPWWDRWGRGL